MAKTTTSVANTDEAGPRGSGGRPPRDEDVLRGALAVFGRDGYTRATMDAIAAEAGVSTRTIYNHFPDKAALFRATIEASATRVAESQIAIIERHFAVVDELASTLVRFGLEWARPRPEDRDHLALVQQINAEARHIPAAVISAWQTKGPRRVQRALARQLSRLNKRGLLQIEEPDRAALHLMLLVGVSNYPFRAQRISDTEREATVRSGVRAFLHGYAT